LPALVGLLPLQVDFNLLAELMPFALAVAMLGQSNHCCVHWMAGRQMPQTRR